MRRTDRLFEIIQLFRYGKLVKGDEIARRLEVSLRTVYRDVDTLVASGVPIEGERGLGYILREPVFLPPLTLKKVELEALHLGMAVVAKSGDVELAAAANDLLKKIDAVLPCGVPRSGHRWSHAVHLPHRLPIELHALSVFRGAIQQHLKVNINYLKPGEESSARTVRPLQIEFWGKVWTVTAWCDLRDDFRVFRLDRLARCEVTAQHFVPEHGKRLADYLAKLHGQEDKTTSAA
jgi:predicted DNA-binding transcriptional regulator YafY